MIAPVDVMGRDELIEYIEALETENKELRAKTDNSHKLSPEEVRDIRALADSGSYSHAEIALEYGVNKETIRRTVNGEYHAGARAS